MSGTGGMLSLFNADNTDPMNPIYSFNELTAARDAEITMGGGALTFSSSTNTFDDIVPGISVTATSLGTATLSVGRDLSGASGIITTFVESLNGAIDYLNAPIRRLIPTGKMPASYFLKPISVAV